MGADRKVVPFQLVWHGGAKLSLSHAEAGSIPVAIYGGQIVWIISFAEEVKEVEEVADVNLYRGRKTERLNAN